MADTPTLLRQPPPPPMTIDPVINRWFHDIISFIAVGGGIDTSQIPGYTDLQQQVSNNTTAISTLNGSVASLQVQVTNLNNTVTALQNQVNTNTANITALQARSQVYNGSGAPAGAFGNIGDWYADVVSSPKHIYVKTGASAWTQVA